MTRIISDSKLFSFSNISATFAIVGLVGAVIAVSNYDNVYALETHDTNVRIGFNKDNSHRHYNNHRFHKEKNNSKKRIVVKTPNKAFVSFGHKDKSTFILVNFEKNFGSNITANSYALANNIGQKSNVYIQPSAKILKLGNKSSTNQLRSISTRNSSAKTHGITGLKLIAGGVKKRGKNNNYSSKITGLQKVAVPKNGLQFVAGISQNKLNTYMVKNCASQSVCDISNFHTSKTNTVVKVKMSALSAGGNVRLKELKNTPPKAHKTIIKHTINPAQNDEPLVIMLDDTY